MKKEILKKKGLAFLTLIVSIAFLSGPVWAGIIGDTGYGVSEVTIEAKTGKSYSGGLDLVYSQVAGGSAAAKTRSFIKCEDGSWTSGWSIEVNMYDYRGNFVSNLAGGINPYGSGVYSVYCQGLKVDPTPDVSGNRTIWFSMTGNGAAEGDWYTVTVDSDFESVVSGPTARFSQAGNWETEWDPTTGQAFYAGKETDAWAEPHAIYIYTGSGLQKVVDVGGYSCGFAFDPDGNLYTGTYTDSGPATQQQVRMYTTVQVQAAINGSTFLSPTDASNTISIPSPNGVFLGANDLESDPDGNIYLSANGAWDTTYGSDVGYVYSINAWNPASPPSTMIRIAAGTMDPANPDWQKGLAYDGSSNLAAGGHYDPTDPVQIGNRLYVDQDFWWGSGGPDVVSGLAIDTDTDTDGVPDALDNAYQTANADQRDTDQDMYGNMADADFDNNGFVNFVDRSKLGQAWNNYNPDCDFDGNGTVNFVDKAKFGIRFNTVAPWF